MKKNVKLAAVVLASMLVLAACGKTESVEASVSETSTEASVEASISETSVEASVEELVEEVVEEEKEEVASVEEQLEEVGEIAEGTLEEYLAKNPSEYEAMKAQESATEGLTIDVKGNSLKQMTDAVKLVEQGCGIDGLLFTITYVDMNDVVVYTCNINNAGIVEE